MHTTCLGCNSENAIVVVGTVIEPEMEDELRVTIVITGLGNGGEIMLPPKMQPTEKVESSKEETFNYVDLDKPAVIRNAEPKDARVMTLDRRRQCLERQIVAQVHGLPPRVSQHQFHHRGGQAIRIALNRAPDGQRRFRWRIRQNRS